MKQEDSLNQRTPTRTRYACNHRSHLAAISEISPPRSNTGHVLWETSFSYAHCTWSSHAMPLSTQCTIIVQEILLQPMKWEQRDAFRSISVSAIWRPHGPEKMMLRSHVWEKFSDEDLSLLCSGWVFWKLVEEVLLLTLCFLGIS